MGGETAIGMYWKQKNKKTKKQKKKIKNKKNRITKDFKAPVTKVVQLAIISNFQTKRKIQNIKTEHI